MMAAQKNDDTDLYAKSINELTAIFLNNEFSETQIKSVINDVINDMTDNK